MTSDDQTIRRQIDLNTRHNNVRIKWRPGVWWDAANWFSLKIIWLYGRCITLALGVVI